MVAKTIGLLLVSLTVASICMIPEEFKEKERERGCHEVCGCSFGPFIDNTIGGWRSRPDESEFVSTKLSESSVGCGDVYLILTKACNILDRASAILTKKEL